MDPRYRKLADVLIGYSTEIQPGDKLLIEATETPRDFVRALVEATSEAGGIPIVLLKDLAVQRAMLRAASEEQLKLIADSESVLMDASDAYIAVRGADNVSELSDVPSEGMKLYESLIWKPVHIEKRIKNTRWLVMRWPSPSMAQLSETSTEDFEDFFFNVCTLDYAKMSRAMQPLQELMEAAERVRLVSPGTDLSFSIKDIPAVCCDGKRNIPDGEVYTAPVRDSINGTIQYNVATVFQGVTHEEIRFEFKDGKIVDATSTNTEHCNSVLDSDEGSRYVGEFAIGFNPHITKPMKDILFDEKIAGSIHLTPGNAYESAFNGNRSQIHWDLVLKMDPDSGGGEIYFDDRLIRKDGRFVVAELEGLNPENLT
jgi:aminopeptidase